MEKDTFTETEEEKVASTGKSRWGINKNLIMLKVTLFFLYGATSSLLPYLTIHMQSLGISMEEIALVYLSLPMITFLAPPITGFLVDKFGRYKPVVIISFILTAVLHHSLYLLPHEEIPGQVPSGYVITHPGRRFVDVWWSPCPNRDCPVEEELDMVLDMCVDHCLLKEKKMPPPLPPPPNIDVGNEDDLFFHLAKKNRSSKWNSTQFTLDMHPNLGEPIEQLGIDIDNGDEEDDVMDLTKRFKKKLLRTFGVNVTELIENDLRCGGHVLESNPSSKQRLSNYSDNCIVQKCHFVSGGPYLCDPEYKKVYENIFWIYFVLRFLATLMQISGITLMDPIALTMIEKYGGDFGKEKLFSSLGMALFSPITGFLIDIVSKQVGYVEYGPAFYAYDVLLIISSISVYMMPLGTKLPADNVFHDLKNIFKRVHVVVFIVFLFILGNFWGFIESFLFPYLKSLHAANSLLGATVTVGTVSSMPFLWGADKITNKIGHINIIIMAFFAHAARLVGYSFIENPWWCFPFEALESLSVQLMWVAAATYCASLAPKSLLATLIGVLGMAHFSIGRGSGSFIGGHLIGKFGITQSFRIMGMIATVSGAVYGLLHYFCLRKTSKVKEPIDEEKTLQNGEPKYKDQSTMVSFERLSLMIEYNQIGSLTSLGKRDPGIARTRSNSIRRSSYQSGMFKQPRGSASKVDLLKSNAEMSKDHKNSMNYLSKQGATSASKVYPDLKSTPSSVTSDRDLTTLIPNENDEILYDTIKTKSKEGSANK